MNNQWIVGPYFPEHLLVEFGRFLLATVFHRAHDLELSQRLRPLHGVLLYLEFQHVALLLRQELKFLLALRVTMTRGRLSTHGVLFISIIIFIFDRIIDFVRIFDFGALLQEGLLRVRTETVQIYVIRH